MISHSLRARLAFFCFCIPVLVAPASGRAEDLSFTFELPATAVHVLAGDAGDRVRVDGAGYAYAVEPGEPLLPYRTVSVLLPPGTSVASFVAEASAPVRLRDGVRPERAPEVAVADGSRGNGPAMTAGGADDNPSASAVFLGTGYLHGHAIASFALYPVRVDEGVLTVHERIELRVTTAVGGVPTDVVMRARHRERFAAELESRLARLVVNPSQSASYVYGETRVAPKRGGFQPTSFPSLDGSPVDYVIVTNDSLAPAFQALADWKTAKGIPTVIRTTEWIEANYKNGVDLAETIRTFVIDAYQKWGITYLLLGGDVEQIPVRLGASKYLGVKDIPVDMYFGCLDGDWNADHDHLFGEGGSADQTDLYQEVYVGRLPVTSSDAVDAMVGKIISYETPMNLSYTGKVLLLAEVLFPVDWQPGQAVTQDGAGIAEYLRALALDSPPLTLTRMYQNNGYYPGTLPETATAALDSMEAGYDHVNHIGHGFRFNMSVGSGSILNADADAMVNPDRYSNLYLLNCTAVAYTYFCLGEHFLLNPNGGAVSVVGANESAYPLLSQPYMNEYYDLLFNDGVNNIGETFARSREPRTPTAQLGDNGDLWTHYIYSILADPEMPLWTASAVPMSVSHTPEVGLGVTPITVTVTDVGGPVADARVCLSKDDDDYEVGYTDASGSVTMSMTVESAGEVTVVASAFNRALYVGSVTATAGSGAYLAMGQLVIDDDSAGGTSGNGDGVIDGGETVDFVMSIVNTGGSAATNVQVALRSSNFGVNVPDSLAAITSIGAGQSVPVGDPLRVSFVPGLADGTPIEFVIDLRQGGVTMSRDSFTRRVHAPKIEFDVLRSDDVSTGDGDGIPDDNEDVRVFYSMKNFGTGAASGLTATLTDVSGAFVFTDSVDTYPGLVAMASSENTDGFLIRETSVASPHNLRLDVTDASGRTWAKVFELRRPEPPTALLFDPSLGFDRLEVRWSAGVSTDVNRYRLYRSEESAGPFELATVDPIRHTLYVDTGLNPTTRYYYRATAVDLSGNESAASATYNGSTNPAQVEGWPIAMSTETVSSPVIGDIDGDHDFEIVQGNGKLYAWHHDGVEVRDADGNSQTWGLFSMLGNSFVSATALAEMDAVPGHEILAASRDTKEVFVFSHTGDPLPGWPRPVLNAIRAAVVAGDIDNDGQKEVIAIDEKGVLYVWHADGTEYRNGDNNASTQGVFRTFAGCSYQYTCPAIADFDADDINEIIVGTQGDSVYVINSDGSNMPDWPRKFNADISGSIAVGDIDDDGDPEMVVCDYAGNVSAVHHTGAVLWVRFFQNTLAFGPSPALGDLDGDGKLEVVIPSKNRNLYAVRHNGGDLPGWPVVYATTLYTESSPVIADVNYDGLLDVVLGDENKFLNAWSGNGQPLDGFPLALADAVRATPAIADLDKDGDVEVIATGWDKSVYVWDFPDMFDPLMAPWPKFHANLYNDGNVDTPVPTPVSAVAFWFEVGARGVALQWDLSGVAGGALTVLRAEIKDGVAGTFREIAHAAVGPDGVVRLTDRQVEMGSRYAYRLEAGDGVVHETAAVYVPVSRASLGQNSPNPFNPVTRIEYWVAAVREPVSLIVYDVRGARVRTLVNGEQTAGRYAVEWDGRNDSGTPVGSGVYFYRMVTAGFTESRKMVLLK